MLILSLQNNIACARSFEASFIQKLYLSLALVTLKIRARKKFFMRARKKKHAHENLFVSHQGNNC